MRLLHRYVDIQKDFFIDLSKKFKENKIEISSCDLERLKSYIRIPTESNRVAFVNILEKYIFTYNINVNDFFSVFIIILHTYFFIFVKKNTKKNIT